jgi:hypothetical protein
VTEPWGRQKLIEAITAGVLATKPDVRERSARAHLGGAGEHCLEVVSDIRAAFPL